ncbi:MAG: 50S ribosomal protein L11 methyltransferase [Bdellovibrionales bacterium]
MNTYFVLRLEPVTNRSEDWLSQHVFAAGALGMSEALDFSQPEGEEDVFAKPLSRRAVDVYFESVPNPLLLEEIRSTFPEIQFQVNQEANRDWLAEWKKSFKPFELCQGTWIVPSWCEPPREAHSLIHIDPGMAFGTGTHETTQLVSEALVRLGSRNSLLDVGTGTGVLAILAARLGYRRLVATELEPEARRVATENFVRNSVQVEMDCTQVQDLTETFDVVVANIIDGVLVRLQEDLKARVRPGGWLIVSGIIGERESVFLQGFQLPTGRSWQMREAKGDWRLFAVQL